jgi:hypothetical protein
LILTLGSRACSEVTVLSIVSWVSHHLYIHVCNAAWKGRGSWGWIVGIRTHRLCFLIDALLPFRRRLLLFVLVVVVASMVRLTGGVCVDGCTRHSVIRGQRPHR